MITKEPFKPAWWLFNGHLQTIWPTLVRRTIPLATHPERLELPDGDFLDLAWTGPKHGPIVIVLHGLAGCIESPYVNGILHSIIKNNWRGLFVHFRGCSGIPNRLPRFYHSGETGDLDYVIAHLRKREPNTPLAAVGYSLGGNVLVKWLSKHNTVNPLTAAVAISVPFELNKASKQLNSGFSRFYQWYLLRSLRRIVQAKFKKGPAPIAIKDLGKLDTFEKFDDQVTAPLHGFADAQDYYFQASSRSDLKKIIVPTLILQARDDPFVPVDVNPEPRELAACVTFELHETGGHVGFVTGNMPWQPVYWLEQRITDYLKKHLK